MEKSNGGVESGIALAVSLSEQIACVIREIGFRERFYPRWVLQGKLTQAAADTELARMRAVLETLRGNVVPDNVTVSGVKLQERERVLAIVARHMHSSTFVRVAAKVAGE